MPPPWDRAGVGVLRRALGVLHRVLGVLGPYNFLSFWVMGLINHVAPRVAQCVPDLPTPSPSQVGALGTHFEGVLGGVTKF